MIMKIENLKGVDFNTIYNAFDKAFSDYEIGFKKDEVRSMLTRRGFNPDLSFAAFQGNSIIAFTLNGTGVFNDMPTAYDTGTGTLKEYRGQGIAQEIFRYSIPYLKEAGIKQYLLEVLQNNTKAISIYRRMGFETTRELDCFRQIIKHINIRKMNTDCAIEPIGTDIIRQAQLDFDFIPSWQNNIESIERGISELTCIGAFLEGKLVGHCVFDIHTGDLTQIVVRSEYRRKGIASRLLQEVIGRMHTEFIKVLNISSGNSTMSAFLKGIDIPLSSKQFEMVLPLWQSVIKVNDGNKENTITDR